MGSLRSRNFKRHGAGSAITQRLYLVWPTKAFYNQLGTAVPVVDWLVAITWVMDAVLIRDRVIAIEGNAVMCGSELFKSF